MISLVPEGTQIPVRLSELWRPVRLLPGDHLRHPRHSVVHRRAGLQHAAAGRSGWRDLSARHGRLSRGDDRTSAAWLQRGRRSEAFLSHRCRPARWRSVFSPEYTTPAIVSQAMDYIITGKAPAGTTYKLREAHRLPRHDRRHVLDHRRRPARQLQLLKHSRPRTSQLRGDPVALSTAFNFG